MKFKEGVSAEEYKAALQRLSEYKASDKDKIHTLDDLSELASPVARALRVMAQAKGFYRHFPEPRFEEAFNTRVEGDVYYLPKHARSRRVVLVTTPDRLVIHNHRALLHKDRVDDPKHAYMIIMPLAQSLVDDRQHMAFAHQGWSVDSKFYLPFRDPSDPDIQQGFARVLDRAVVDLLPKP